MPVAVLPLVLLAAVCHASWNALLKASENPLSLAARAMSLGTLVALPPVAALWLAQGRPGLPLAGWLLALASAGLELGYFITLSIAYQRGELSVVYPIARGTAPLLAVVVGPDGRPRDIHVARSVGLGLDEKAIEAVKTWRFEPAKKDNQAVSVAVNIEVSFNLY